jgi:hypothetical protein
VPRPGLHGSFLPLFRNLTASTQPGHWAWRDERSLWLTHCEVKDLWVQWRWMDLLINSRNVKAQETVKMDVSIE